MDAHPILERISRIVTQPLFTVSQTEVTLSSILIFILLLSIIIFFSRFVSRRVLEYLLRRFHLEENLSYTLRRITEYTLIVLGAIIAFQFIGINLSGLAVVFGFLSVGIGFGLQNVTSNFISGLILLFERPIRVGDRVSVGDVEGDVTAINIRSTTIRTVNNISIIVPNSEFIASSVINWSHGDPKIRVDVPVGVSYSSDLDTVLQALRDVARENPDVLVSPEPQVHLRGFGDSSWDMQLRVWIGDPKRHPLVTSDLNCAIVRAFRRHDIEIPFPQRDLHLRSSAPVPIALPGGETADA